jgi:hypothetical protein
MVGLMRAYALSQGRISFARDLAKEKEQMVPPDYLVYFTTMATVGATLFGLIFVVISIAPASIATESAPLERQVKALTAYSALLNPVIISLFALVPHQQIGFVVIVLSLFGLLNTFTMVPTLVQHSVQWSARFRNSFFILAGFLLYGSETYAAVRLLQSTTDSSALNALTDLLIIISIFGVARAWELVGIRQFQMQDWLSSLGATNKKENASNTNAANVVTDLKNDEV